MIFTSVVVVKKYISKRWVKHKTSMNTERDKNIPLYQKMNELGVENFLH